MSIIFLLGIWLLTQLLEAKASRRPSSSSNAASSLGGSDTFLKSSQSDTKEDCDARDLLIWLLLLTIGTVLVIAATTFLCLAWRRIRKNTCCLKQKITYMEMETILRLPEFTHCDDE